MPLPACYQRLLYASSLSCLAADTWYLNSVSRCPQPAQPAVKETMNGFLTDSSTQSLGFAVLAALSAAAGTLAVLAPERVINILLQSPTDPAVNAMTRLCGAALLLTATAQDTLLVGSMGEEGV